VNQRELGVGKVVRQEPPVLHFRMRGISRPACRLESGDHLFEGYAVLEAAA
jgi:hypothetical protein